MKTITPSGFQFTNPRTKKLLFQVNDKFDKKQYNGVSISYEIRVNNLKESTADVELEMHIGEDNIENPFYIELTICAEFRWTDDIGTSAESLLKQNGVTLLMSYARPIIAHTTADAGFRPFNLPFVDLRNDIAEMK